MNSHIKKGFSVSTILLVVILTYFFTRPKLSEIPVNVKDDTPVISVPEENKDTPPVIPEKKIAFQSPIQEAENRVTKKPFGILITKETSPIQPERFSGYHTGTDFEILPKELNDSVSIVAICDGILLSRTRTSGYGGVAVQSCTYDDQPITIVYGHLKLESITMKPGDSIQQGDLIGNLGNDKSSETDGERKHLHLSIHRGSAINLRGYVNNRSELVSWIDPLSLISPEK